MKRHFRTVIIITVLSQMFSLTGNGVAGDSHLIKRNPQKYLYQGSLLVDNVIDKDEGVVVYMVYPKINEFQDVTPLPHSTGEVIPVPGNEFDTYLKVSLSKKDFGRFETKVYHEFLVTLYDVEIDFSKIIDIKPYDTKSELYRRYTGSADAPLINPKHPEIVSAAKKLKKTATDYLDYARKAFLWARNNPVRDPGAAGFSVCNPRSRKEGLSGANAVFVSLLRQHGIPARITLGRGTDRAIRMWAEFYLEGYGWIPSNPGAQLNPGDEPFRFFGTTAFPNRIGQIRNSVILNHVYGDNVLPSHLSGERILYNSLAYFLISGVSKSDGYRLFLDPVANDYNIASKGGLLEWLGF